jgi:hypothetical protein
MALSGLDGGARQLRRSQNCDVEKGISRGRWYSGLDIEGEGGRKAIVNDVNLLRTSLGLSECPLPPQLGFRSLMLDPKNLQVAHRAC